MADSAIPPRFRRAAVLAGMSMRQFARQPDSFTAPFYRQADMEIGARTAASITVMGQAISSGRRPGGLGRRNSWVHVGVAAWQDPTEMELGHRAARAFQRPIHGREGTRLCEPCALLVAGWIVQRSTKPNRGDDDV